MKKIFLGIICLLFCQISFSQNTAFQDEWSAGVNAGVTLSKMRFTPSRPQDMLQQGSGGIVIRYISENHFGIQAELNYSLRGWKERTDTVINLNQYSRSLAYLELPVMTHLYFNLGKRARLIFNVGPQIGFNIGEKELERVINTTPEQTEESFGYYDLKVQRAFDYGIAMGGGLEIRTGIGYFILEGRYYFGLADVFSNTRSDFFQSSAHQVIGVKLTYLLKR
ncbi:MAG: PorT family protein [Tannerella sp.]|jgi:hypothetical protein|nr:PorT family protein [Tannerella sp.]